MTTIRISNEALTQLRDRYPGYTADNAIRDLLALPQVPVILGRPGGQRKPEYEVMYSLDIGEHVLIPWKDDDRGNHNKQRSLYQAVTRCRKATGFNLKTEPRPGGLDVKRI